jgi:hypothetical protein
MNGLSIRTNTGSWETTQSRFLRRSISQIRATRLALALSAALLSPAAFDALAASTTTDAARRTFVNADPNDPQGSPLTVQNCNDDGPGSLRDIIDNVAQTGDTINLSSLYVPCGAIQSKITLTTGEILVPQNDLTLLGPDNAHGFVTISGGAASRVFHHTGSGTLTIKSVTIADGYYQAAGNAYGGCVTSDSGNLYLNRTVVAGCTVVSDTGFANGGGIAAYSGDVALVLSKVSQNRAIASGKTAWGGGIYSGGTLSTKYSSIDGNAEYDGPGYFGVGGGAFANGGATIAASTIYNNVAATGGGLQVWGNATIVNSTISGNTASNAKGGSAVYSVADSLTILNSTIAFNHQDPVSAFGVAFYGSQASSVLTLQSSIVANNTAGAANTPADLYIGVGHGTPAGFDNLVIASNIAMPPAGFITVSDDPQLGPLRLNGGWTRTHAPLPGSPALGTGNNNAVLANDQRGDGYPRTTGPAGSVDIGAVQFDTIFADNFDFD